MVFHCGQSFNPEDGAWRVIGMFFYMYWLEAIISDVLGIGGTIQVHTGETWVLCMLGKNDPGLFLGTLKNFSESKAFHSSKLRGKLLAEGFFVPCVRLGPKGKNRLFQANIVLCGAKRKGSHGHLHLWCILSSPIKCYKLWQKEWWNGSDSEWTSPINLF